MKPVHGTGQGYFTQGFATQAIMSQEVALQGVLNQGAATQRVMSQGVPKQVVAQGVPGQDVTIQGAKSEGFSSQYLEKPGVQYPGVKRQALAVKVVTGHFQGKGVSSQKVISQERAENRGNLSIRDDRSVITPGSFMKTFFDCLSPQIQKSEDLARERETEMSSAVQR